MDFECKRDELTIRGRIFGDISKKSDLVILSHGFGSDRRGCEDFAHIIEKSCMLAVSFDFCGGGPESLSDGKTEDMTVFSEAEDLIAVVDYFAKQPYTTGISLLGFSQGGLVSALVAERLSSRIDRLVLVFPAFCIPDDARAGRMLAYAFDPDNIPETLGEPPMRLGRAYAASAQKLDIYNSIGKFSGPVLFLHGTADPIVDISYARRTNILYSDCEYHEIKDGGHGFAGEAEMEARELLSRFLKK